MLRNPQEGLRLWASEILALIGPKASEAASALAEAARNDEAEIVRRSAQQALANICPDS